MCSVPCCKTFLVSHVLASLGHQVRNSGNKTNKTQKNGAPTIFYISETRRFPLAGTGPLHPEWQKFVQAHRSDFPCMMRFPRQAGTWPRPLPAFWPGQVRPLCTADWTSDHCHYHFPRRVTSNLMGHCKHSVGTQPEGLACFPNVEADRSRATLRRLAKLALGARPSTDASLGALNWATLEYHGRSTRAESHEDFSDRFDYHGVPWKSTLHPVASFSVVLTPREMTLQAIRSLSSLK